MTAPELTPIEAAFIVEAITIALGDTPEMLTAWDRAALHQIAARLSAAHHTDTGTAP